MTAGDHHGRSSVTGPTVPVSGPEDGARDDLDRPCVACHHRAGEHDLDGECWAPGCECGTGEDDDPMRTLSVVADTTAGEAEAEPCRVVVDGDEDESFLVCLTCDPGREVCCGHHLAPHDGEGCHEQIGVGPGAFKCQCGHRPAARSGGAQDNGLRARVEALAKKWERRGAVRDFGLSLTDAARELRALAGPDDARQDGVCEAVNPETGRRCVRPWPHDGMHQVADGRWFDDDPRRGLPTTSRPWT